MLFRMSAAPELMECGVCWHVYEPIEGDPDRDIPPGTAFADLPADWHCPVCDAPRDKFVRPAA